MSDINDACIAFLGSRAENLRPGPLVHLTNLFEELHIAASKSRQNMAEEILKSCSKKFLRINLSSCHRRNTFQLNVDGFLKQPGDAMELSKYENEALQWDET